MALSLRSKSEQYRNLIILWMRVQGLTVTGKIKFPTAAAAAAAIEISDGGHIWGTPLSIVVRNEATRPDLSEGLDAADLAARAVGKLGGAVIQRRAGRPDVEDSWALLSLATLTRLLVELESAHGTKD
jgi:hypothetical protein